MRSGGYGQVGTAALKVIQGLWSGKKRRARESPGVFCCRLSAVRDCPYPTEPSTSFRGWVSRPSRRALLLYQTDAR